MKTNQIKLALFKTTVALFAMVGVFGVFAIFDKPKPKPQQIEPAVYHYQEPKDWVNDSTVSIGRRLVYDHLEKQTK